MTLAQLKTLVRDLIRDNVNYEATSPDSQSALNYTNTQVVDAINYAIKNYCDKTGATYIEAFVNPDGNGIVVIPTDYIRVEGVSYPHNRVAPPVW